MQSPNITIATVDKVHQALMIESKPITINKLARRHGLNPIRVQRAAQILEQMGRAKKKEKQNRIYWERQNEEIKS